jgi:hypothetical protein
VQAVLETVVMMALHSDGSFVLDRLITPLVQLLAHEVCEFVAGEKRGERERALLGRQEDDYEHQLYLPVLVGWLQNLPVLVRYHYSN